MSLVCPSLFIWHRTSSLYSFRWWKIISASFPFFFLFCLSESPIILF
jgi:hypothetical protein